MAVKRQAARQKSGRLSVDRLHVRQEQPLDTALFLRDEGTNRSGDPVSSPNGLNTMYTPARDTARQHLADWFRRWRAPLLRHLTSRARLSSADADDLAQEVFLRMLRYDRAELVTHPQAYLFRIAANVLAEWSTRASWRQPHAAAWLADLTDERDPERECTSEDDKAELERAIGMLPPRSREILRLHYDGGLTHEAIAARLGVTRRIVKRDLIRAYADLRGTLGARALPRRDPR